jgi:hypothetical protein
MHPSIAADIDALRQDSKPIYGSEQRRKAIAQAFVRLLTVEERDTIQPSFYVRGALPRHARRHRRSPHRREEFRAMAPMVVVSP